MAGLHEIGLRRAQALEQTLKLLGLEIAVPSTKASAVEQLAFQAQLMEAIAERVASHTENIDALAEAVTGLRMRATRKAKAENA